MSYVHLAGLLYTAKETFQVFSTVSAILTVFEGTMPLCVILFCTDDCNEIKNNDIKNVSLI